MPALFDSLKQLLPDEPGAPVASGHRRATGHDRERSKAGVSSISTALSIVITRGNCPTVATPGDVEDELRHLIAVVRA